MIATKSSSDDILRPILAHVTKRVELASLWTATLFYVHRELWVPRKIAKRPLL
ncbi:MAG TPA: hypothetical protein GXX42_06545 [Petrimonas sp.]|uniref:hypothetical protein n=1 Tax=Petrimonas sp. TaxID=2023866 RepID=UPI00176C2697|nr:hypothetical protein [Petrimonas sp.]MEA5043614.1 hypothetical protein [Petrimonas sp.]MEA5063726.1 hypothetical protein [Petrimonas sp.]HHV85455.1 hypothetical protein [Petrimonas sp.]